ncbi:MAG: hypothetical protein Q4F54_00255 [Coriobacteriia bacterium]|nr:hypothetical protein [Coriobacteriia bacterium]
MNSREKQRRAMHAKGGALARVRQLPLYMKIINVVLAVVLALGVGSNWAYAAELLPEAGSEAVTVAQDGSQTLTSASVGKANSGETVSYAWQILNQATGDFIEINGEVASTITVDYAMLKNQLDENNTTTVRSVVYDSSEKVIAQKDYYISMDMNMKTIGEAVQANALASFPGGETLYAEGQSNDPINAEYAITINYVDSKGHVLLSNSEKFQEQTAIRWFVQLPGGYTTNNATVKSKQPADVINIAYQEPDLKLDGLYITSANGITGNVEIDAVVASEKFPYDISAEYEKLITGDYDPPVIIPGGENGEGDELGAVIPSDYDKTYLTEVYKGKGWEITYNVPSTVRENKQTVSVKLSRTYSTLYFDLNDGINGPVAVYIKQGVSFNTVKAWKQGTTDVYLPSPTPFKNAYNFDSWNTAKDGSGTKMPTDNWAKDTNPAPGTDTTYYAQWVFSGTDTTPVTVVLAY